MQTKKRAKPVKFGVKPEKKVEETPEEQEKLKAHEDEPKLVAHPVTEEKEEPTKEPEESSKADEKEEVESKEAAADEKGEKEGGELVDKLSDVPFETDFGTPKDDKKPEEPATPEAPDEPIEPSSNIPSPAVSVEPTGASEPEEPASPATPEPITPLGGSDVSKPEDVAPVSPDTSSPSDAPDASGSQGIPPIGRANEPIPFNPHDTVFNTPPDAGDKRKNPIFFFLLVALVAFLVGLAFMAGMYYAMPQKSLFALPSMPSVPGVSQPTPTTAPVQQPSPTTAPTVPQAQLAQLSIRVLNGSGVRGQAAEVKTMLESAGFKVASIGNADRSDVTKTQIVYKKTVSKDALTKLKDALKKTYVLEKESELPASVSQTSDIVVTIGKETVK